MVDRPGDEKIQLYVDGQGVGLFEDYDVQSSVLQQPAAFSVRLGWSGTAAEILNAIRPGAVFDLRIADRLVQSGRVDERSVGQDGGGTFVEVKGRDWMAGVFDSFVEEERSFANATYYDLTRTVLDLCGLQDRELTASDTAHLRAVTGTTTIPVVNEEVLKQVQTGVIESAPTKVVNKTLKAKLGERWYDWLQRQYKRKGLFLWCSGRNFTLSRPRWDQPPTFTIVKARGAAAEWANVLHTTWRDSTTNRHTEITVYGRGGGGAAGRTKVKGKFTDPEMVRRGLSKRLVVHDEDCKTLQECEYAARRTAAEERRAGWTLQYTLSGHVFGPFDSVWVPNTTCRVIDDEIPIDGTLYIESVQYSRKPETTTTITLMRPEDLVFALESDEKKKPPGLLRQPPDANTRAAIEFAAARAKFDVEQALAGAEAKKS